MSSKPSSNPGVGSKRRERNNISESESAEQLNRYMPSESMIAEARRLVRHEVRERRNGYQTISTTDYYRTERRGHSGFGEARDWVEAKTEIDSAPGIKGALYRENEPDS